MADALIIFLKNNEVGKVKTRLARSVGVERASDIYQRLVEYTATVCMNLSPTIDIHLFYGTFIPETDPWHSTGHVKRHIQLQSPDLGERMITAFRELDATGYQKKVIIGTDCPYLEHRHILEAFKSLNTNDIVLGPALDGGFYLLGCLQTEFLVFEDITWSTSEVLNQYLRNIELNDWSTHQLEILEDIDDEPSMNRYNNYLNTLNYRQL